MIVIIKKILRVIDTISEKAGKIFSYLILIMVAIEVIEVFRRYVLQSPTDWSWELVAMLYGAHFIMAGAWVLKENSHVRTDIFFSRFSPKLQALIDFILFSIVFFVFAGVMTWQAIDHAAWSFSIREKSYTMWGPPIYPLKTVIAVGYVLLLIQGIAKWIRDLIFVIKGEKL